MKESSFGDQLKLKIVKELGGKIWKIADKSTLGLPDYIHINKGVAVFFEIKELDSLSNSIVNPWDLIVDIRQFEVCRKIHNHSLVLFVMYFSKEKRTLVMNPEELQDYRFEQPSLPNFRLAYLDKGHGIIAIKERVKEYYARILQWNRL